MAHLHDTGYKFLFSHADLVRELLETFAPPGLAPLLDYATLCRETGSFITPAMKQREDDIVWSVELSGQRIYLYLLLEFQSSVDRGMPVRIMQYVSALYDHLVRSKSVDLAQGLPPVLPIVLYNGDARWRHSPEVFDLIQPHPSVLREFQPRLKFWLLDEGRFSADYLEGLQGVVAAIFRMEHPNDTEETRQAIRYFGQMVANSPFRATIGRAAMEWLHYRLSHKMPGLDVPDIDQLLKGTDMLETRVAKWRSDAVLEGKREGLQEGRQEGWQEAEHSTRLQLLQLLLNKRFGPLDPAILARLPLASTAQLDDWFQRALDASSLTEVFDLH